MEFWGVEVKHGDALKVTPELGKLIHISQIALGEVKDVKEAHYVPLRLKFDDKNYIIGSLSAEERTQIMVDLVFEKHFELSHDLKDGSIYFMGYKADDLASDDDEFSSEDFSGDEEDLAANKLNKLEAANTVTTSVPKTETKKVEMPLTEGASDSSDSDDENDDSDDSDDAEEIKLDGISGDSDDLSVSEDEDDDISSGDEDEPPKAAKKRPAASPKETTLPSKKAKTSTPNKTGDKKVQATLPTKAAAKTPDSLQKSNGQTPKSNSQLSGKPCNKPFTSKVGMKSQKKAKHGAK